MQERKVFAKLSKTNPNQTNHVHGGVHSSNAMNGAFINGGGSTVGGNNTVGGSNPVGGVGGSVIGGSAIGSGKNAVVMSKGSLMYRQRGDSHDGPLPSLSGDPPVL